MDKVTKATLKRLETKTKLMASTPELIKKDGRLWLFRLRAMDCIRDGRITGTEISDMSQVMFELEYTTGKVTRMTARIRDEYYCKAAILLTVAKGAV